MLKRERDDRVSSLSWIFLLALFSLLCSNAETLKNADEKLESGDRHADDKTRWQLHEPHVTNPTSNIRNGRLTVSGETDERENARVFYEQRYQLEAELSPSPEVAAKNYGTNSSIRPKRGFFEDQKLALLEHIPIGGKKEEETAKRDWETILEQKAEALSQYNYPATGVFKHKLQVVGRYLIMHKYFEIDWRYEGKDDTMGERIELEPEYMVHFPVPRLKTLHPDVVASCDKGVTQCVDEIFGVAILTPSAKARQKRQRLETPILDWLVTFPFRNRVQQLNYRTSASYYMCWYTMQKMRELEFFSANCFDFAYEYEAVGKRLPRDSRSTDEATFRCALLSFCPDTCCGNGNNGVILSPDDCFQSQTNPCREVADGFCDVPPEENTSFTDLMRNRINYTCNCKDYVDGFEWNIQFKLCVDKDECYDDTYTCAADEVCRNTVGGYDCVCRRGYLWNSTALKCERHYAIKDLMADIAVIPEEPKENPEEGLGFDILSDIRILLELFASTGKPVSLRDPVLIVVMVLLSRLLRT